MCGTIMKGDPRYFELDAREGYEFMVEDVPDSFDSRENWPDCKVGGGWLSSRGFLPFGVAERWVPWCLSVQGVIGHIRDQSACGSCWAFATTEAFNDRLCISKGFTTLLSPTDTTACCHLGGSMGCNGGQPAGAWQWFTEKGVVTGGDYEDKGSEDTCLPYPFPSCAHHVDPTPEHPACPSDDYSTPTCRAQCSETGYSGGYSADKHKAKSSYSVRGGVAGIQKEIMENGETALEGAC
jgi:hypothetical protein